MKANLLLAKIRTYLHDPAGVIWTDVELTDMLSHAAEAYSSDTGAYRGNFQFFVSVDGVCTLPKNYLGFVAGWNRETRSIQAMSAHELPRFYADYSVVNGLPEFIYEELDSSGEVRFCPNPYKQQSITIYTPFFPYGMPELPVYGVPTSSEDYGIPQKIYRFNNIGDIVYFRSEAPERIQDYMALIYHVLSQAYHVDSDFADSSKASFYYAQYRSRIARFGKTRAANTGLRKRGNFY